MMQQLANKVIFLTGGSMGIGLECAKKYAEAGAKLVIMANDKASLETAIAILGKEHSAFFGDISNELDVKNGIELALNKYQKIDVIHNNAGIANPAKPLHETNDAEWQNLFDVNLKGILYTTRFGLESSFDFLSSLQEIKDKNTKTAKTKFALIYYIFNTLIFYLII